MATEKQKARSDVASAKHVFKDIEGVSLIARHANKGLRALPPRWNMTAHRNSASIPALPPYSNESISRENRTTYKTIRTVVL